MARTSTISATPVLILAATMLLGLANAVSPAAAPGSFGAVAPSPESVFDFCLPYLLNLSDCLDYVSQGSNLTKPSKACCPEIKNLLGVQPKCLCELLAHPEQSPIPIDLSKALKLPSVCKIGAPPVSTCAVIGVPIGGPTASATVPTSSHANAPSSVIGVPTGASPANAPSSSGTTLTPEALPSSPTSQNSGGVNGPFSPASQRHFIVGLSVVLFTSFF